MYDVFIFLILRFLMNLQFLPSFFCFRYLNSGLLFHYILKKLVIAEKIHVAGIKGLIRTTQKNKYFYTVSGKLFCPTAKQF